MPKVPSNILPFQPLAPKIDPTALAMAAAMMHREGRLFEPVAYYDATQPIDLNPKRFKRDNITFELAPGVIPTEGEDEISRRRRSLNIRYHTNTKEPKTKPWPKEED